MNNIHPLILTFLVICLLPMNLSAKHLIGGEMNYKCLGNGDYEITLRVYRDCLTNGANFDREATFSIFQCDGTIDCTALEQESQGFTFTIPLDTVETLNYPDPTCELPQLCVEQGIYRFRISEIDSTAILPNTNNSYHIVHQRCCRNGSITNIETPEEFGNTFTIAITPIAQEICNTNPTFDNFPPVITCVNELFEFQQLATDAEGDSLVYVFSTPLHGGGNDVTRDNYQSCAGAIPNPPCPPPYATVPYIGPLYSTQFPFGNSAQAITIQPETGLITGIPTLIGQFVAGLSIKEYRNGQLISITQREFQINVINCQETNDRVGSVCDDGNPNTEKDRIQEDCGCRGVVTEAAQSQKSLFISEYLESSTTSKCIELYNPLDQAILPSEQFVIKMYNEENPTGLVIHTISAIIPAYGVYVVCHENSDTTLTSTADGLFDIDFDGNEAITLEKNGLLIDLFGNRSCFPEDFWRGTTPGIRSQNKTLVRCPCIQNGVKADPVSCEFPALSEEWICLARDDFRNLGIHDTLAEAGSFIEALTNIYCACAETCRERDSLILVALYTSTNGDNWRNKWDLAAPLDTWFGVTLNEEGCITCLDLDGTADCNNANTTDTPGNNLIGYLPDEIGELKNLENLYLSNNQLSNILPRSMGKLIKLQKIWLNNNNFSGNFPIGFILLDSLQEVVVDHNQLTGELPPEMATLKDLFLFTAANNQLVGCFPEDYLNLCTINTNFSNNPALPWEGDFTLFCENGTSQIGASCDDKKEETLSDIIQEDCTCKGKEVCVEVESLGEDKAPVSLTICDNITTLSTTAFPPTFTGQWTSSNDSIIIANPTDTTILLNELPIGITAFLWSSDTVGCRTYLPAKFEIIQLSPPVLQKDSFTIADKITPFKFSIFENDNTPLTSPLKTTILSPPDHGMVNELNNGNFEFLPATSLENQDRFTYEVCYIACPTLCDQSVVFFQLEQPIEETPTINPPITNPPVIDENLIPNTITPNGDGLNDQLVFPQLLDPNAFPNNELLLFNRWGDAVFSAHPYDNTWEGTDQQGQALMEGTYYYILRLEVGAGVQVKGEIVILK